MHGARSWADDVELSIEDDFPADAYDERQPRNRNNNIHHHIQNIDEDFITKPKFAIPIFLGGTDVEDYLTWELKLISYSR